MADYTYTGADWVLDGKVIRHGDTVKLTDAVAQSLMSHGHALAPTGKDGVQPFVTGRSDIVAAGVAVDEFGQPLEPKGKK